jgi:polysaccharide export outer membrane protein
MRIVLAIGFVVSALVSSAWAQALRPGDTLEITVYQDPKLDRKVLIGRDGTIGFPLAGHVRAAGLTPQGVEAELRKRLQKNYTDPLEIVVALAEGARPEPREPIEEELKPRVYLTGELLRPGSFPIRKRTTVMQAIALAGGLGPYAAKRRIQIRRQIDGSEAIYPFDYVAFERGEGPPQNIDLKPGDVIIVPERGLFE